ncbi:hypothetical protein ACG1BZ_05600 [Microbulbifer sp. CNSA002]|uniref:hypothetical protein n=1 Tax=Microbulbifer sp. CNSA002 TaxID=3373604 RepID=UPI0039B45979
MNKKQLLDRVIHSNFPAKKDLLQLLSKDAVLVNSKDDVPLKVRSFLGPIRSKIKVMEERYEATHYICKALSQSKHLISMWKDINDQPCDTIRLEKNQDFYYLVFYNPENIDVYGAIQYVNSKSKEAHIRRNSQNL